EVLLRGCGQHPGQGDPGQPHDLDCPRAPGILLAGEQGLCRTRAPGGTSRPGAVCAPPPELEHHRDHPTGPARPTRGEGDEPRMSAEDLEKYETDMELQLYREYRDVVSLFSHVVETE